MRCFTTFVLTLVLLAPFSRTEAGLDLPSATDKKEAMTDLEALPWEPIYPEAILSVSPEKDDEYIEDDRVHQVRVPRMAAFVSKIGEAPRAVVVICPGGGYGILSLRKEGKAIAEWLNALGVDAYVLKYRLMEYGYPAPLQDVTRAVRLLRSQAAERGIDPERIGVMGFSAGGHAAGMATVLWDSPDAKVGDKLDSVSARPDFSILAYPVATMRDPYVHAGSRKNLLGDNPDPERMERLSLENSVTAETPPVFLMHTAEDKSVPAENSLHLAEALLRHDVPVALHLYTAGNHGLGMLPGHGAVSDWPEVLAGWLRERRIAPAIETP